MDDLIDWVRKVGLRRPSPVATDDLRIHQIREVSTPQQVIDEIPLSSQAANTTALAREEIHHILTGKDSRLLVICGPCSIHDTRAAVEYAQRISTMREKWSDLLCLVMRVYFEKPRTTVGWKGLINDPDLDGSYNINKGLRMARKLLLDINEFEVPAGTEFLDILSPQYIADLVSWGAIGARTTESQVHRELVSGLSCPVGLKNGTAGTLSIAVDAIRAAASPHVFLSFTKVGHSAIFHTKGNGDCHLILRGGRRPNYDSESIDEAAGLLNKSGLPERVMVDFSHANSRKQPERQKKVCLDICGQIRNGDTRIIGVMIESHLNSGRQEVVTDQSLQYGQSITDACVGWEDTELMLTQLAKSVSDRRQSN